MKTKNIVVITYWSFGDALIQTYTLPYLRIIRKILPHGIQINLITLEKWALSKEEKARITEELQRDDIVWLPRPYHAFGLLAVIKWLKNLIYLSFFIRKNKIDFIHCWCTPAGAIGYVLSIITGKKLILDSYEPHAEAMVENGTWKKGSLPFHLLFRLERWQSHKAFAVIGTTQGMRDYARMKYDVHFDTFFVKPACVDVSLFSAANVKRQELVEEFGFTDKIVCVYAGKLGGIYLDQEVFDFLSAAYSVWQNNFRVLLLTSHSAQEIETFCKRSLLEPSIVTSLSVPHSQVANYIGLGDFAITPVKPVSTKRYCTPIKNGEYWALGLPVIIPKNISDDSDIIEQNTIGYVLPSLDRESYMSAVHFLDSFLKTNRKEHFEKIRSIAFKYRSFAIAENVYKAIYTEKV